MKARPAKNKKRTLHQPPAEMVEALEYHDEGWAEMMGKERAKLEKGQKVKMPSKQPPSRKWIGWAQGEPWMQEPEKSYQRRLKKWHDKHGK